MYGRMGGRVAVVVDFAGRFLLNGSHDNVDTLEEALTVLGAIKRTVKAGDTVRLNLSNATVKEVKQSGIPFDLDGWMGYVDSVTNGIATLKNGYQTKLEWLERT